MSSNVLQDTHVSNTYYFSLEEMGTLIGTNGKNVKNVSEESDTFIDIHESSDNAGDNYCEPND